MVGFYKDNSIKYKPKRKDDTGSVAEFIILLIIIINDFNIIAKRWQNNLIDFIKQIDIKKIRDFCKYKLYEYQQSKYYNDKL